MKHKLKGIPPIQRRRALGATAQGDARPLSPFVGRPAGREVEAREIASKCWNSLWQRSRVPTVAETDAGKCFRIARESDRKRPSDEWEGSRVKLWSAVLRIGVWRERLVGVWVGGAGARVVGQDKASTKRTPSPKPPDSRNSAVNSEPLKADRHIVLIKNQHRETQIRGRGARRD
jgi:hypothetical protein